MKIFKLVVCEVLVLLFTIMAVYALYINDITVQVASAAFGIKFIIKASEYA